MGRDKRVDEKIAKAAPFARPILEHLRALVHATIPGAGEAIKWGMPHFTYSGKNVAGMAAFKAHCAFIIHGEGRQGMDGGGMGSAGKIASLADLPPDAELQDRLRRAQGLIDRGEKPASPQAPPKPDLPVPQDFAAALKANVAARKVFDAFSLSQQREYVAWVTEAKADATRERRLKQAIEWIADGKRRNWKYEAR